MKKYKFWVFQLRKCYVDEVMDNINENWNRDDVLATYGVINMKILLAAQKDEELKEYNRQSG